MTAASAYFTDAFTYARIRSDDGDFADADMVILLSGALKSLSTHKDWPWLHQTAQVSTVAQQRTVTLDTSLTKAEWFAIEDTEIKLAQRKKLIRYNSLTLTQQPYLFKLDQLVMSLYPLPDTVYVIDYAFWTSASPITAASDTVDWPDEYSDVLVWKLVSRMAMRKSDYEMAGNADREVRDGLREIYDNISATSAMPEIETRGDW